jgi:hypothetical protein
LLGWSRGGGGEVQSEKYGDVSYTYKGDANQLMTTFTASVAKYKRLSG